MNALGYLGIALVIAVVGGIIVAVALREPSTKRGDGVDQFRRRMSALAPEDGSVIVPSGRPDPNPEGRPPKPAPESLPPTPPSAPATYDPPVKPIPRPRTAGAEAQAASQPSPAPALSFRFISISTWRTFWSSCSI